MITAAVARGSFLDLALEARAHNLEQHRLIFDPSPDPDSLLEVLHLLRAGSSHRTQHTLALARLARRLAESNSREGMLERTMAGNADRLVRDLRDLELNGTGEAVLASKAIARAVREPLRTLLAANAVDRAAIEAIRQVDQVLRRAPALQVLSATVRYELGDAKYLLLAELAEKRRHRP